MRRLLAVLAVALSLALALAGCGGSSSSSPATDTAPTDAGDGAPAALDAALARAAASGVPVRIPPALVERPPAGAEHAEVLRSPPDSYTLALASQPRCRFKSTCVVAIFSGSSSPGASLGSGNKLRLAQGIEGVYEPGRCGPGCSFGTVAWRQGRYAYGVGVPEASARELVVLADEAIEAAPIE
jgi:hypothetical protein